MFCSLPERLRIDTLLSEIVITVIKSMRGLVSLYPRPHLRYG